MDIAASRAVLPSSGLSQGALIRLGDAGIVQPVQRHCGRGRGWEQAARSLSMPSGSLPTLVVGGRGSLGGERAREVRGP